ncbi:MAG: Do family serine endopeptidase [Pseudomonadota bacterium]
MNDTRLLSPRAVAIAGAASIAALAGAAAFAQSPAPRLVSPPLYEDGTLSFADLVERVSPSVVSVNTEKEINVASAELPPEMERFFRDRFGLPFGDDDNNPFGGQRLQRAQGSGFFIDDKGHIVTNHHVVNDADEISVTLATGEELQAELVGSDQSTDLAVLKVKAPEGQSYADFATDVDLRVGDWVIALGNPFGLGGTVTSGIVSALGRDIATGSSYVDFIQVDAPINRGNSGGPTFDLKGRVVGVNTAIISPNRSGGSVGIGFAIPAKTAEYVVGQLIDKGQVTRGWLGVSLEPEITPELALALGLKEAKGALIADVIPETPAAEAGFKAEDIIVYLDGKKIEDSRDLTQRIGAIAPGKKTVATVLRDGKEKKITVKLGEREDGGEADVRAPDTDDGRMMDDLGVRFSELDANARERYRIPDEVEGVLVSAVAPSGVAADARIVPGMVILEVDGEEVESPSEVARILRRAAKEGKEAVLMRIQQQGQRGYRALPVGELAE